MKFIHFLGNHGVSHFECEMWDDLTAWSSSSGLCWQVGRGGIPVHGMLLLVMSQDAWRRLSNPPQSQDKRLFVKWHVLSWEMIFKCYSSTFWHRAPSVSHTLLAAPALVTQLHGYMVHAYVVRERREILVPCSLILEIRLSKLWRDILSMSSAAYLQTLLQTFYPDCAVPLIGKPCRSAPFAAENGWNHSHWFYFVEV